MSAAITVADRVPSRNTVPVPQINFAAARHVLATPSSGSCRNRFVNTSSNGPCRRKTKDEGPMMPDYEIRLFHADGSLAVVHVSSHETQDEAAAHARLLVRDHARYEVRV